MSQLLSFYEAEPINLKGEVELAQRPMRESDLYDCTEGVIQARSVYVVAPGPATKALLVPFGTYDDWSLRDRYNEALRIMGDLGAREIECVTYRSVSKRSRFRFGIQGAGAEVSLQKVENSGFDFHHVGRGSEPRDPAPLKWPNEPGFEAARRSVLHNGASSVTINISSSTEFTADSSLAKRLKKLGFDLGLSHERDTVNTLHITAHFPGPTPTPKKGIWS